MATDRETVLIKKLQKYTGTFDKNSRLKNFNVAGTGLDFLVCRAESEKWGVVAVKTPWQRKISNDNDADMDSRDLMRQEVNITRHLRKYGLPLPLIHHFCIDDNGIDFLITQFIDNDDSPPDMYMFGHLMKEIHDKPVPQLELVAQVRGSLNMILSERISRRSRVVVKLSGNEFYIPTVEDFDYFLDRYQVKRNSLLHMDARPANLLTQNNRIVAIIDWANALIGDRGLDLARIAEYGHLNSEFKEGYGRENCFSHLPKEIELIYRLDTAVMLGVVFLSEAPDPQLAKTQVKRILELYEELKEYM